MVHLKIKRMKITSLMIIVLTFLVSCQTVNENDIYGKYSPISYHNTYDTLSINQNNTYSRKVYDKRKKLLLNYSAKFVLLNTSSIKFEDFYLNLDRDLIIFPNDVEDTDLTYTTNFDKSDNEIRLCFGYHEGENCYKKVIDKH